MSVGRVFSFVPATLLTAVVVVGLWPHFTRAQSISSAAGGCNQQARDAVTWVDLPGKIPFLALPSADGCWIFVSLAVGDSEAGDSESAAQIAVFRRQGGQIVLTRRVQVGGNPTGMVLTHDGKILIAADGKRVAFLDTGRLASRHATPVLGYWNDGTPAPGRIYVNVTADDKHLFISDEGAGTITVLDLAKARASGFAVDAKIGSIPVGRGPVALTFSPDQRYLYSTTLTMQDGSDWPRECVREYLNDSNAPRVTQGGLFVIDVNLAISRPAKAVVAVAKAGCTPVRLTLSPQGETAYVTARGDNALVAFDTARLISGASPAQIGSVPTRPNPIGVAVLNEGRRLIVTNSNRFGATAAEPQSLLVLDSAKIAAGKAAIMGTVPAGSLPRELRVTADGRTLFVVNTGSRKLQVIDLARLTLQQLPVQP
jgi:DNA-binding beta-propeller fold protein YncE